MQGNLCACSLLILTWRRGYHSRTLVYLSPLRLLLLSCLKANLSMILMYGRQGDSYNLIPRPWKSERSFLQVSFFFFFFFPAGFLRRQNGATSNIKMQAFLDICLQHPFLWCSTSDLTFSHFSTCLLSLPHSTVMLLQLLTPCQVLPSRGLPELELASLHDNKRCEEKSGKLQK